MKETRSFAPPSFRASARSLASSLALAAAGCAALASSASAISMRDDVPNVNSSGTDNPYVALGASTVFNAIGNLQITTPAGGNLVSIGNGTGMLVQTTTPGVFKFLTAAHNVDPNATGTISAASTYDIYFGASTGGTNGPNATASVEVTATSISESPQWVNGKGSIAKGSSQYDLAVITFTLSMVIQGTLPTNPLGFSLASPLGKTGTLVGYGKYGTGNNFGTASLAGNGVRRAGNNTIDFVGTANNPANTGFTLQTDFDSPSDTSKSTLGSAIPLTLEATTASGDSGGPLLVQNAQGQYGIAGVLNGGYQGSSSGAASEYGDRSIWASVTDADNMTYLLGQGVAVPEPSTYALLALGLTALVVFARRRGTFAAN